MKSPRRRFLEGAAFAGVLQAAAPSIASAQKAADDLLVNHPAMVEADGRLRLDFGPECLVLNGGLQPSMLGTASGALIVQAQMPEKSAEGGRMHYPFELATSVSRDVGKTWTRASSRDAHNLEGGITQLRDSTILALDTYITPGQKPDPVLASKYRFLRLK
jgi:hypothetical protein